MPQRRYLLVLGVCILTAATVGLLLLRPGLTGATGGNNSITAPDTARRVGEFSSLALDDPGNPVVSYYDNTNQDLKLLHCNDANCAGGGESVVAPDTAGDVGSYTSLALDGAGNPVVSYYDVSNRDLKLLHCDDANCAGGDESITSPDTGGRVGSFTSLALDASGSPVVSYYDADNGQLKVLHCNDSNCSAGGESITFPDPARNLGGGGHTSLALDASGNPVVGYEAPFPEVDLKVIHCNDPDCAGGDESIASLGSTIGVVSLALDPSGNPVVSYDHSDISVVNVSVLHCNDPNCVGGDESFTSPDPAYWVVDVDEYSSLVLDAFGNPVVSYYDRAGGDLNVLHCNDPNCAGGDESITSPDLTGAVGQDASLALDASGDPVVSYYDLSNQNLKVLHCNDPNCSGGGDSITAPDTAGLVGRFTSLALDGAGSPVVSYYSETNQDLKVLHCNDPNCAGGDDSITAPDTAGNVGSYTSLALDGAGNPVVSYRDDTGSGLLKVLHCDDRNCAGGGESVTSLDTGPVGFYTSLALDASGYPVVSYWDGTNADLKVLHCNDANCTGGGDSITSPDTAGYTGSYTSLALDAAGNPVVSYYDGTNADLKVLHCYDANCAAGGDSVTSPDTGGFVGYNTSLALDAAGNPVVSYYDGTNQDLKVLHCNDANCSGGGESVTAPDTTGDVGSHTSLALDGAGNPVVSYFDSNHGSLKLLHCGDPNCAKPLSATATVTGTAPASPARTATPTRSPTPTGTPTPTPFGLVGDANKDGRIDAIDAALVLQYSAGLISSINPNADANHNGQINAIDAAVILQYVAGLIDHLPP